MKKMPVIAATAILLLNACKKTQVEIPQQSSFILVNATTDVVNSRGYASATPIYWKPLPATDAAAQYRFTPLSALTGNNTIKAVSAADTTIILYSSNKEENFEPRKFSTLFLCGNTDVGYDGVFLPNESSVNYTDSVVGIRFINLSPNSEPISITLSTTPSVNEATGLAYKQKTAFKTYPSHNNAGDMIFQLRDAGGVLLASYTLPVIPTSPYTTVGVRHARFKNITLAVKGLQGTTSGTNAFGIFPVPHY